MTTTSNQEKNTQSYTIKDWQKGYESQPNEYDYWIEEIEGEIPKNLQGTLFRNGPGLLDVNGIPIRHPFDGDGMICAFTFEDGRCHFRNRFVQTKGYLEEQKAGKILYRGFGTQKPGGWLANIFDIKPKNVSNTNVIYWSDKLLAMWEAGLPYSLNPANLDTIKLDNLNAILQEDQPFSAHPHIINSVDGNNKILVNFGVKTQIGLSSKITIFEIDNQWRLISSKIHDLPGWHFLHDMAITQNYYVFFQNPLFFNPLTFLLGLETPNECLKFKPNLPTQIILISRHNSNEKPQVFKLDSQFVFHHANAWEKNGDIYLESVCYDSFPQSKPSEKFPAINFDNLPQGILKQFKINLASKSVESNLIFDDCNCDFPTINSSYCASAYRYIYLNITHHLNKKGPLGEIIKIDKQTNNKQIWKPTERSFAGEPIFVPFPDAKNEDDGWLLVLVYDASIHRSYLSILDARDLTKQPLAKLNLKHHIPHGFHGNWTGELRIKN